MDDSDRGRFSLSLVVAFSFSLETASELEHKRIRGVVYGIGVYKCSSS